MPTHFSQLIKNCPGVWRVPEALWRGSSSSSSGKRHGVWNDRCPFWNRETRMEQSSKKERGGKKKRCKERKGKPGRIFTDAVVCCWDILTRNLYGADGSPRCATPALIRLQLPRKIRFPAHTQPDPLRVLLLYQRRWDESLSAPRLQSRGKFSGSDQVPLLCSLEQPPALLLCLQKRLSDHRRKIEIALKSHTIVRDLERWRNLDSFLDRRRDVYFLFLFCFLEEFWVFLWKRDQGRDAARPRGPYN